MKSSDLTKKNNKYVLKYLSTESYYKNSLLLESMQHFKPLMKGKLLDLGCGNKPYFPVYNEVCDSSIGCDVPFSLHKDSNVEVLCNAEDVDKNFSPQEFDCIICTEVLEHTSDDRKVVAGVNRILKPGGNLVISAPFTYVLHEAPHDYRRYTIYGLKSILEQNGFEIKSMHSMGASVSSGFYVLYYSLTKTFFFIFKKLGAANLRKSTFINAIVNFPELIICKFNMRSFRRKLKNNAAPSANEMFSSLGYFITAMKVNEV